MDRQTAARSPRSLESVRQCGVALCIVLGVSVLAASVGSSVVRDRVSGAKRLQHLSGLGYAAYWLSHFLYDMVGSGATSRVPACQRPAPVCVCARVLGAYARTRVYMCVWLYFGGLAPQTGNTAGSISLAERLSEALSSPRLLAGSCLGPGVGLSRQPSAHVAGLLVSVALVPGLRLPGG